MLRVPTGLPAALRFGLAAACVLAALVLIGGALPADDLGIVVAAADSLADAPRVMVPRGGGCWHER